MTYPLFLEQVLVVQERQSGFYDIYTNVYPIQQVLEHSSSSGNSVGGRSALDLIAKKN